MFAPAGVVGEVEDILPRGGQVGADGEVFGHVASSLDAARELGIRDAQDPVGGYRAGQSRFVQQRPPLVAGQEHGDALGDAGADQVAGGGAAAIVEEAGRHAGRL